MLSDRGLCDELITRPEESYRLWCVVVCDLKTSRIGAPYIYDISNLRVNTVNGNSALTKVREFIDSLKECNFSTRAISWIYWTYRKADFCLIRHTRAIPKSTSDWLVKKTQNREQNFIIRNSYIHT